QSMTGQGGWPMTVFLTPDGTPFYGGTYFPPVDRHGLPGFPRLLQALADAWTNRRADGLDNRPPAPPAPRPGARRRAAGARRGEHRAGRRDSLLRVSRRVGAVRRRAWRARRRPEIPAADDLGVRAAVRAPQRQSVRAADGAHDAGEDGARRDL